MYYSLKLGERGAAAAPFPLWSPPPPPPPPYCCIIAHLAASASGFAVSSAGVFGADPAKNNRDNLLKRNTMLINTSMQGRRSQGAGGCTNNIVP